MGDLERARIAIQDAIEIAGQEVLDKADHLLRRYGLQESEIADIFKMLGEHDLADAWEEYINE